MITKSTMFNEELISSLNKMAKVAARAARALKSMTREWKKFVLSISGGDPRAKHLALHARKARTRKKNYHRILKENRRGR